MSKAVKEPQIQYPRKGSANVFHKGPDTNTLGVQAIISVATTQLCSYSGKAVNYNLKRNCVSMLQ